VGRLSVYSKGANLKKKKPYLLVGAESSNFAALSGERITVFHSVFPQASHNLFRGSQKFGKSSGAGRNFANVFEIQDNIEASTRESKRHKLFNGENEGN